ncbi:NUDIX domain-containing protein [Massilia sp. CF038]|uniref:NUDIX domain-containing protein n=1 Tax=Massilia sp. CF038 TaxID=1881045 RepID=UPI001E465C72|nr:NUDIX hydrolase [Massilia sp. CF038]
MHDSRCNQPLGDGAIRSAVRAEVAAIAAVDALEQTQIDDTLAWIDSGAQLFRQVKPATPPKHLVSYFVVHDGSHVLLADHRNAQLWLPTGGHVDDGEHPRSTVERELQEELGFAMPHPVGPPLMLTASTTVGLTAGHTDVSLWYQVRVQRDQAIRFDAGEFVAVGWFAFDEVPFDRCDPHMARFLRKCRQTAA